MTKNKIVILIETKGDHLENTDARNKLDMGKKWESKAGEQFKYFMVFEEKELDKYGAFRFDSFIQTLKDL